ncbi:hypothetical protein HRW07_11665 [Streptomyces lunaelactis]|uniref:hypothetical protein n=1 Tax=Streptomyces lunaelactis TaxID=1535768 RepID=UPI001584C1F9|nr:hypothetical protein [Streptomyces lunaelactis]NUL03883.1 hypothetical protein [Streptomyces lunaelactis]
MAGTTPEAARHAVSDVLAVAVATRDTGLAAAAREAFTHAMSGSFLAGACGVVGAAVLALFLLQSRKAEAAAKASTPTQDQFAAVTGH